MIPMSDSPIEQNHVKIEINQESILTQKSPEKKTISNSCQNNSNIKEEIQNNLPDTKALNLFLNEFQNIAKTGCTMYTWEQLKPYVIYYYEKNVKFFEENKNKFDTINFSHKKSSGYLGMHLLDKKDSNIKELDLNNIINENDVEKNISLNISKEFNFHDEYNDNIMNMNMNINMNIQNRNSSLIKEEILEKENESITKEIIENINNIKIMPFTLQRIAELLLEPEKYYSSLLKYNRAFNKLVNIDFY
jgi:hypothetical protein